MVAKAECRMFDAEGRWITSKSVYLPDRLDWMPIEVKAFWFRHIGQGPANTKFVLLNSQGEQRLITDVTLTPLDYKAYKEKERGSADEIEKFIEEGNYSRVPRNQ